MKIKFLLLSSLIIGLLTAQCLPLHQHIFDHSHEAGTSGDTHMTQMHIAFDDHNAESHADEHHIDKFDQVLSSPINIGIRLLFVLLTLFSVVATYYLIIQRTQYLPRRPLIFFLPWRILDSPVLRAPPA